jgi:uncharacterized damage-inducible protein DinB
MDLLDRLLGHDAWTTRQLLERCRGLDDAALDREFDLAHRTLRATFLHIVWNMEAWSDLLAGLPIRPKPNAEPAARSVEGLVARLDAAAAQLARVAKSVRDRGAWDARWREVPDDATTEKSYGGTIAHVITHSMHHRAQALAMMKWLGMKDLPEGDVLSWEDQARG